MSRILTILFRRDPARDRQRERVHYEGYQALWPDGCPVTVGFDAFCKHGQRLLGLGKHLAGCRERLIQMICMPIRDVNELLHRLPGHRVRRFFIERRRQIGRIHFMDGTPTSLVFVLDQDEPRVLHWIGLSTLGDGDRQWFDLAAKPLDIPPSLPHGRLMHAEVH